MASITKRGDKWLVRVVRKGFPQINKTFTHRKDAEAFAAVTEGDIARGTYRKDTGNRVQFRELLGRYMREVTPQKRGAVKEAYRVEALLRAGSVARPMLDKFVADLTPHDVAAWRDCRLKEVSASTLKREWIILSHCLEVARLDWGHAGIESPFKAVRRPEVRDARDRRLSADELAAVVSATGSAELGAFIRLAVETCARRGELLSLQWRDIDLKKRIAKLSADQTKNGTARVLPLSPAAIDQLRAMPRRLDGGQVFSLKPDSASQAFRRAVMRARKEHGQRCALAGVEPDPSFLIGVRLHDLRHEGISRIAEKGWSALEVAAVSGHKTLALLQRYTHLQPEKIAQKLAAHG